MKERKSILLITYVYILLGFVLLQTNDISAQPVGYSLSWSDEFDGTGLDNSKWQHRYLGPRKGGVNVEAAIVQNGDGNLMITTTKVDNEYHVGMIGTQQTFQTKYGYFECRAKLQKEIGFWTAFWLQSPTYGSIIGNPAESGTEIDIYEYLRPKPTTVHHNLHWDGYGDFHKSSGKQANVSGVGDGWHKFAVEWTENEYIFFVDDNETWRTSTAVSQRTEYIILSAEVGDWAGNIANANLPDTTFFDYVRVYKKDDATGISDDSNIQPESFLLLNNYPNPFNPSTKISYQLPENKFVSLKVYDMLGKEIASLVNQRQSAGKYDVQFNSMGLSSGTYFYRLKSGDFIDTKTMIFIK